MNTKQKWIGEALLLLVSYGFGYYTAPYKTEIKTEETKSDSSKTDIDAHKTSVKVEETKPDGSKIVTTTTTNDIDKHVDKQDTRSMSTEETKTKSTQPVTISALFGASLTSGLGPATIVYGLSVSKPVLGPISIGIWGLTGKTFGASLGLQF